MYAYSTLLNTEIYMQNGSSVGLLLTQESTVFEYVHFI